MQVVIVGSIAYDDLESTAGEAHSTLGGSATYAGLAAAFHIRGRMPGTSTLPIGLVGVVGEDFRIGDWECLESKGLDLRGVERRDGSTFRWRGRYSGTMDEAETLETQLNVFGDFDPNLPEGYKSCDILFLANIHPSLQASVLDACESTKITILDSMNLWISTEKDALSDVLRHVDMAILNDAEIRMLAEEVNLMKAIEAVRSGACLSGGEDAGRGPSTLIVKKGENGVLAVSEFGCIALPSMPTSDIVDPTGCGDSFAGSLIAHLVPALERGLTQEDLRSALIHATVTASFTLSAFGSEALVRLDRAQYAARMDRYRTIVGF